jgi:hypothetical protein
MAPHVIAFGNKPTMSFQFFRAAAYSLLLSIQDSIRTQSCHTGTILPEKDRNPQDTKKRLCQVMDSGLFLSDSHREEKTGMTRFRGVQEF